MRISQLEIGSLSRAVLLSFFVFLNGVYAADAAGHAGSHGFSSHFSNLRGGGGRSAFRSSSTIGGPSLSAHRNTDPNQQPSTNKSNKVPNALTCNPDTSKACAMDELELATDAANSTPTTPPRNTVPSIAAPSVSSTIPTGTGRVAAAPLPSSTVTAPTVETSGGSSRIGDDSGGGAAGRTLAQCMEIWSSSTHMTKAEWRTTCVRTLDGFALPTPEGSTAVSNTHNHRVVR